MGRKLRIYHAPFDVGGNSYYLSRAERELGHVAKTFVYFRQWFGYPVDRDLKVGEVASPLKSWRWWVGMAEVLLRADVVHFNFGTSFLSNLARQQILADVAILDAVGIATFVTFQGCDSRISEYALKTFETNACAGCRSLGLCSSSYNFYKQEIINACRIQMDGIFVVNPDLLHNIKGGKFLPYSNCDTNDWRPPASRPVARDAGEPVKILHAPTWRDIKGSEIIIEAVSALEAEGENVELMLVENIPHAKVRELYERCDLLVDQVLVGWYGGLAVELMALGKPVVAYLRPEDLQFLPDQMRDELPVISASPATLKEVLRELVHTRTKLAEVADRSRAFVERWHSPIEVARTTTAMYHESVDRRGGSASTLLRVRRNRQARGILVSTCQNPLVGTLEEPIRNLERIPVM